LQIVHKSRDMERLDLRELVKVFGSAPVGEAAGGIHIGPSRMGVVDLCREKFEDASRGFSCRRKQRRRPEVW
jgi:hypothetical protein